MGKGALGKKRLLVGFHGLCGRSCARSGLFHDLTSFQEVSNTYLFYQAWSARISSISVTISSELEFTSPSWFMMTSM